MLQRGFQTRQLASGSEFGEAAATVPSDLIPFDSQRPVRSFAYGADFDSCFRPTSERTLDSGHASGSSIPRRCKIKLFVFNLRQLAAESVAVVKADAKCGFGRFVVGGRHDAGDLRAVDLALFPFGVDHELFGVGLVTGDVAVHDCAVLLMNARLVHVDLWRHTAVPLAHGKLFERDSRSVVGQMKRLAADNRPSLAA